jgi:hypothetical protein
MNNSPEEILSILDEMKRRKEHTFSLYSPLDLPEINQLAYHCSRAWCRLVFGGNRSGKSRVTAQEILWWGTETHPYQPTPSSPRIWVISPEYRTIYEGIWIHIRENLPGWLVSRLGVKIPQHDIPSYVEFKKGARIDFISAEGGESDRKKIQAAEIDLICIDEEVSGDLKDELMARLITTGGRLNISATLIQSEDWLLDLEEQAKNPKISDVELFRFNTKFNPHNNPTALKRWEESLSPEEREVRILGRSRQTKGIIYRPPPEVKISRFDIPISWPRVHVFDPGHRVAASLWFAIDPDSYIYCYREMYLLYSNLLECVNFWKSAEGWELISQIWIENNKTEKPYLRIIDPASFNTLADGSMSIGEQLSTHYNYYFIGGLASKDQNIEDVRRLFIPNENPRLKIFEDLTSLWTEIRKYRIKDRKVKSDGDRPKARPLKQHDHLMNCLEYFASQQLSYGERKTPKLLLEEEAMKDDGEIDLPEDLEKRRNKILRIQKIRQRKGFHDVIY